MNASRSCSTWWRSCTAWCRRSTRKSPRRWRSSTARRPARRGCRPSCTSDPGRVATWTAIPTCTPRAAARRCRASSRWSSTAISRSARASRSACRRARAAWRRPPHSPSGSSSTRDSCRGRAPSPPRGTTARPTACSLRSTSEARAGGYESARQSRDDVALIAASLSANKGANAGLFYVERLLRRIDTFGFHLATLDVRQHASVLHQVVAGGFDDPLWLGRSSRERRDRLAEALEKDRGPVVELDALGKRNLAVFDAIMQGRHRYGPDAIGYFIVSGASGADDVLAALLLARWAEAYDKHTGEVALDLAPQFETAQALAACGRTMQELLADPLYRRHLDARGRRQCVLIGYSDSNKETGACASRFMIHQAQHDLAQGLATAGA